MTELKRQLGWLDVFAVSAGAMVSSGLFVLPALAFTKAGPGVILSYLVASVLILPSVLSKAELASAMPKAGGTYFFVERSMGSVWGLFSGFAGWFSLALKSAFAIVGMTYLVEAVFLHRLDIQLEPWNLKLISVVACILFTGLNMVSVKHTIRLQIVLVGGLLLLLIGFVLGGASSVEVARFSGFLEAGWLKILATSGLVFVSFGGLTKVASIAEEVKDPGRDIPLGMLAACGLVTILYVTVVMVTVGVMPADELARSRMPISEAAEVFLGPVGFALLGLAALAAFVTTANGGVLAASRAPMAMSRDQLLPRFLAEVNPRFATPVRSVLLTGVFMTLAVVCLELESLVKTASTIMIILFILANVSVIIMRESRIQNYRPKFKAPFYPAVQVLAIIIYLALIVDMGITPLLITAIFFAMSIGWYLLFVRQRVNRASAVMHIVERVTDKTLKTVTLENELRDILIERDEIIEDRFDRLVKNCLILDVDGILPAAEVFEQVSGLLSERMGSNRRELLEKFMQREAEASTVIQPGLAIPHVVVEGQQKFEVLLVRAREGILFPWTDQPVHIMFVLAGSRDERNYHLRALMAIAQIAQQKHFRERWMAARDTEGIRNLILLSARTRER